MKHCYHCDKDVPEEWSVCPHCYSYLKDQSSILEKIESDPNGISAHSPGAKLDSGKIMMSLLLDFDDAIRVVAEVATIGAKKYSRGGWKTVPDGYNRYTDAMLRHLFTNDEYDDGKGGTGLLHDAQVAWNALARLQYKIKEVVESGRPTRIPVNNEIS